MSHLVAPLERLLIPKIDIQHNNKYTHVHYIRIVDAAMLRGVETTGIGDGVRQSINICTKRSFSYAYSHQKLIFLTHAPIIRVMSLVWGKSERR